LNNYEDMLSFLLGLYCFYKLLVGLYIAEFVENEGHVDTFYLFWLLHYFVVVEVVVVVGLALWNCEYFWGVELLNWGLGDYFFFSSSFLWGWWNLGIVSNNWRFDLLYFFNNNFLFLYFL